MSAEPAIVLPQSSKNPRKKKNSVSTIRKPEEAAPGMADAHFLIPRDVKRRLRVAGARNDLNRAGVITALSTQINDDGTFKFPWDGNES